MRVRAYAEADAAQWDQFCAAAPMATLLHTRRFLSYHGDRFTDASLIVETPSGSWLGIMPAARSTTPGLVTSHPGSTFGGLLHTGGLLGDAMLRALSAICRHYAAEGYRALRYKAVPRIYHRRPADDDLYALFRLGADRPRCDLSCAIDLARRGDLSERRRRGARKAGKAGIAVSTDDRALRQFWPVLESNLAGRHDTRPVHNIDEIELLQRRFPDEIRLVVATLDGAVVAGTLLFLAPTASHAQYIAASDSGRELGALDAVFEYAIDWAAQSGRRYFDFGISNEDEGRVLNTGLYDFKAQFGASGIVHETFEIDLTRSLPCP